MLVYDISRSLRNPDTESREFHLLKSDLTSPEEVKRYLEDHDLMTRNIWVDTLDLDPLSGERDELSHLGAEDFVMLECEG